MNLADSGYIKDLIQLMGDSDLSEISIEQEKVKLTLKRERNGAATSTHIVANAPDIAPALAATQIAPVSPAPAAESAEAAPVEDKNIHYITAPLVGTFYAAPAPDAPPYAQVGDKVTKGQTLCIVEAMKLMNEIESDVNGTIVEILCDNATRLNLAAKSSRSALANRFQIRLHLWKQVINRL